LDNGRRAALAGFRIARLDGVFVDAMLQIIERFPQPVN